MTSDGLDGHENVFVWLNSCLNCVYYQFHVGIHESESTSE